MSKTSSDTLVKVIGVTYMVVAFFAASSIWWFAALVITGIAMFVAGVVACANVPKGSND